MNLLPSAALVLTGACAFFLGACAAGWAAEDTTAATDAIHLDMQVEQACAAPPPDGGATCNAAQVRALERANLCITSSRLYAHKAPVPDAGIRCQP